MSSTLQVSDRKKRSFDSSSENKAEIESNPRKVTKTKPKGFSKHQTSVKVCETVTSSNQNSPSSTAVQKIKNSKRSQNQDVQKKVSVSVINPTEHLPRSSLKNEASNAQKYDILNQTRGSKSEPRKHSPSLSSRNQSNKYPVEGNLSSTRESKSRKKKHQTSSKVELAKIPVDGSSNSTKASKNRLREHQLPSSSLIELYNTSPKGTTSPTRTLLKKSKEHSSSKILLDNAQANQLSLTETSDIASPSHKSSSKDFEQKRKFEENDYVPQSTSLKDLGEFDRESLPSDQNDNRDDGLVDRFLSSHNSDIDIVDISSRSSSAKILACHTRDNNKKFISEKNNSSDKGTKNTIDETEIQENNRFALQMSQKETIYTSKETTSSLDKNLDINKYQDQRVVQLTDSPAPAPSTSYTQTGETNRKRDKCLTSQVEIVDLTRNPEIIDLVSEEELLNTRNLDLDLMNTSSDHNQNKFFDSKKAIEDPRKNVDRYGYGEKRKMLNKGATIARAMRIEKIWSVKKKLKRRARRMARYPIVPSYKISSQLAEEEEHVKYFSSGSQKGRDQHEGTPMNEASDYVNQKKSLGSLIPNQKKSTQKTENQIQSELSMGLSSNILSCDRNEHEENVPVQDQLSGSSSNPFSQEKSQDEEKVDVNLNGIREFDSLVQHGPSQTISSANTTFKLLTASSSDEDDDMKTDQNDGQVHDIYSVHEKHRKESAISSHNGINASSHINVNDNNIDVISKEFSVAVLDPRSQYGSTTDSSSYESEDEGNTKNAFHNHQGIDVFNDHEKDRKDLSASSNNKVIQKAHNNTSTDNMDLDEDILSQKESSSNSRSDSSSNESSDDSDYEENVKSKLNDSQVIGHEEMRKNLEHSFNDVIEGIVANPDNDEMVLNDKKDLGVIKKTLSTQEHSLESSTASSSDETSKVSDEVKNHNNPQDYHTLIAHKEHQKTFPVSYDLNEGHINSIINVEPGNESATGALTNNILSQHELLGSTLEESSDESDDEENNGSQDDVHTINRKNREVLVSSHNDINEGAHANVNNDKMNLEEKESSGNLPETPSQQKLSYALLNSLSDKSNNKSDDIETVKNDVHDNPQLLEIDTVDQNAVKENAHATFYNENMDLDNNTAFLAAQNTKIQQEPSPDSSSESSTDSPSDESENEGDLTNDLHNNEAGHETSTINEENKKDLDFSHQELNEVKNNGKANLENKKTSSSGLDTFSDKEKFNTQELFISLQNGLSQHENRDQEKGKEAVTFAKTVPGWHKQESKSEDESHKDEESDTNGDSETDHKSDSNEGSETDEASDTDNKSDLSEDSESESSTSFEDTQSQPKINGATFQASSRVIPAPTFFPPPKTQLTMADVWKMAEEAEKRLQEKQQKKTESKEAEQKRMEEGWADWKAYIAKLDQNKIQGFSSSDEN
ncbi:hypothetical protein G9A89_014420 [Geosiphon pyriformis]|nr:hypothetical protein G9A89_014420 [Geosiphon pyriformis]